MKIVELFNTENTKAKTIVSSTKVFPQQEEQTGTVQFRNMKIQNGTLSLDLRLKDLDPTDYTSVVVNSINFEEATVLNNENFPDTLSPASQKILFSAKQGSVVLKPQKDLQNMMNNAVNIERLQKDMDKVLTEVEKLKDKITEAKNGHSKEE